MKQAKIKAIEDSLNGMATKVLACTPIGEAWTVAQIGWEMRRVGSHVDHRVVEGCLKSMAAKGLVREPRPGTYIRSKAYARAVADSANDDTKESYEVTPTTNEAPSPTGPLDLMADLSAKARELAAQANALAVRIEDAAIEFESNLQRVKQDTAKLRQLQDLLKDIGLGATHN